MNAVLPPTALGVTSEAFADSLATFLRDNPDGVLSARRKRVRPASLFKHLLRFSLLLRKYDSTTKYLFRACSSFR